MSTLANLGAKLTLDTADFQGGIKNAESWSSGLGGKLLGIGAAVGTFALVGGAIAGTTALLKDCAGEAANAEKIQAQLNAVLASTKGKAGMSAEGINDLATSLSKITPFEDDTIVSGENMLLTFTNIGKDVFPMATESMLNMSTAMGTDLNSSAIMLGKALNDPTEGISALTRVGVTFNDEQKKTIEQMQATGDMAGAQKIILQELQTEFGNSATAAGSTFTGQLQILENELGNVKELIGVGILPSLTGMTGQATAFFGSLMGIMQQSAKPKGAMIDPSEMLPKGAQIDKLVTDFFANFVTGLVSQAQKLVSAALPVMKALISGIITAIPILIPAVIQILVQFVSFLIQMAPLLLQAAIQLVLALATGIAPALPQLIPAIVNMLLSLTTMILQNLPLLIQAALQIIMGLIQGLYLAMPVLIQMLPTIIMAIITALIQAIPLLLTTAWQLITALADGFVDNAPLVVIAILTLISMGIQAITGTTPQWVQTAIDLVKGLWQGFKTQWQKFKSDVSGLFTGLVSWIRGLLGVHSPSTIFKAIGMNIIRGFADGLSGWGMVKGTMEGLADYMTGFSPSINASVSGVNAAGQIGNNSRPNMIFNFRDTTLDEDQLRRALNRSEMLIA